MTQEALKQALEALKDVGILTDREWQAVHKNKANELRQAIAELESQEPVGEVDAIGLNDTDFHVSFKKPMPLGTKLYTTPPQRTEQEPVALEAVYETIIKWDEGGGKRSRRELARRIVDLYTTPPQRTWQGLTEEDKKQMFKEANYHWEMTAGEYAERIGQLTEAKLKERNT